jgi:hypothetical protein
VKRKITPPDVVSIQGDGVTAVLALKSTEPFFRNPTEQKRDPARVLLDSIPGRGVVYIRWLVTGKGPVSIEINSVKGGRDSKQAP